MNRIPAIFVIYGFTAGKVLSVLLLAVFLAACNHDDDDGNNNGGTPPATETGVFVDSAVAGLGYRTETREGKTNADGEFEYVDGEMITFFIGDIELPAVTGGELITPLDLFDTANPRDQRVVNLARLLQSLDEDGDPDNGISIVDAAHLAAMGITIDFDVPTDDFEANAGVINLVSNGGGSGTLVSAEDALAHLEQLMIIGSWYLADLAEYIAVTFMADGTYMIAEGEEADAIGGPGIEYGTYEWDYLTGEITVEVETDTNGGWGLSEPHPGRMLTRSGNEILFTEIIDGVQESSTFAKATSAENPLIGGWVLKIPEEDTVIVITFTDMHYAMAEVAPADDVGSTGPEFGTYTWNAGTGEFVPVAEVNLNGEWGFSHEFAAITATVDGDTLRFTFEGEAGETLLTRVK